jgi:hypothetical protein
MGAVVGDEIAGASPRPLSSAEQRCMVTPPETKPELANPIAMCTRILLRVVYSYSLSMATQSYGDRGWFKRRQGHTSVAVQ